jgi:hypothetical protein
MLGLWMVVAMDGASPEEQLRVPADWLVGELSPVEMPTAGGSVDLRDGARAALDGGTWSVYVVDGRSRPFTVTVSRA